MGGVRGRGRVRAHQPRRLLHAEPVLLVDHGQAPGRDATDSEPVSLDDRRHPRGEPIPNPIRLAGRAGTSR